MNGLTKVVLGAACALGLTATSASAAIVCNEDGDCWRTKRVHDYRPEFRLEVHPDNWRWREHERRYRWREDREGRGYWRKGVWIEF